MSDNSLPTLRVHVERVKSSRKVLYHFAIFAIINELLIIKNHRINPAYRQLQARGEIRPAHQVRLLGKLFILSDNGYELRANTLNALN